MEHFVLELKSLTQLEQELKKLAGQCDFKSYSAALAQIYTTQNDQASLAGYQQLLKQYIPEITIVGCSTLTVLAPKNFLQIETICSLFLFEQAQIHPIITPVNKGSEQQLGQRLGRELKQNIPYLRGVLMLATTLSFNSSQLLKGLLEYIPDIPVFGGGAGDQNHDISSLVFNEYQQLTEGMVIIAFSGQELRIETSSYLGWIPFGKKMTITEVNGNQVSRIDGELAYRLYRHFIDIDPHTFFDNAVEFPLLLHRDNTLIARVPYAIGPRDSLEFFAELQKGDEVQFGYGDINAILSDQAYSYEMLLQFQPEAILVFSCCCRLYFLKEDARQEVSPFKDIAPAAGFFTFGEFDSAHTQHELLNATIVSVAFSEHPVVSDWQTTCQPNLTPPKHLDRLTKLMHFISRMTEQLDRVNHQLTLQAERDSLTRIYNRRKFSEELTEEIYRAKRYQTPLSLILIDIDHFKAVNDNYGHVVGDKVLVQTTQLIQQQIRKTDLLARFGGEEFVIILPETDLQEALTQAERIRHVIATKSADTGKEQLPTITSSFGVAAFDHCADTFETFINHTDQALYRAKAEGRNRICRWGAAS